MISFRRLGFTYGCAALCFAPFLAVGQQRNNLTDTALAAPIGSSAPGPKPATRALGPEMRGDIYMARKMYREAIDMYRSAPESAITANKIGIAFHQLLQLDLAKKNYERAIKLDSHYAEAINNVGTVYYAQKSYKRAITYYKRSLRYSANTASVYANLGAAYFARKDYKRSAEYYDQALKLDPDVLEHRSGFGTLMQERTVTDLALFHFYLAKTYAKAGANERALIYLRKALEEGLKDRKKLPDLPEFSSLKQDPQFIQLLAENPKPL